MSNQYAYGLWPAVIINSAVVLVFAFSFSQPITKRDWRTFGAFSAFILALFTEMYGFPLTVYLLSGWLSSRYPGVSPFSHTEGHLWYALLGLHGDPHSNPIHIASMVLIIGGFMLLAYSWRVLYRAQVSGHLATSGPYAVVRHPQYLGFIIIMAGYLLQWPVISTLILFPVMVWIYVRQARREDRELKDGLVAAAAFTHEYERYYAATPAFIPWAGSVAKVFTGRRGHVGPAKPAKPSNQTAQGKHAWFRAASTRRKISP